MSFLEPNFSGMTVVIGDENHIMEGNHSKSDILQASIQQSGIQQNSWDSETDALLDSILTGNDEKLVLGLEGPFSDTSSDSGCNLLSPGGNTSPDHGSLDLIGYISNDDEELQAVNPVTFDEDDEISPLKSGGSTTIVMPAMSSVRQTINIKDSVPNRRGTSDSVMKKSNSQKYPALVLTSEEDRLCEREGVKLPSHYPLSREEEKNLKRIRRKIRNKESAQNSRKRKKEYVDNMEDRVKLCTDENEALKTKIAHLEKQNKTLAGQLRRLHQIIVNGGGIKQNQTSTAMMVLLLSTALFLLPGMQKHNEGSSGKPELDISQAVKQPPLMSGNSRSLLHFTNAIKQEYPTEESVQNVEEVIKRSGIKRSLPYTDHDYLMSKKSYIEDDVPPQGYGPGIMEDRKVNVNVSHSAVRTVVLHVPKDIK